MIKYENKGTLMIAWAGRVKVAEAKKQKCGYVKQQTSRALNG
jgi:hypothetical protein